MVLCRLLGVLVALASWLIPATAQAAKAKKVPPPSSAYQNKPITEGATVWYCAYDGNVQIGCSLGDTGREATATPVQVIDPRLPRLVGDIRNNPGQLADKHISIPLLGHPYDFDLVGELAESVMCGGRALCSVIFAETSQALAQLVRAFETTRLAKSSSPTTLAANKTFNSDGDKAAGNYGRLVAAYQVASAAQ